MCTKQYNSFMAKLPKLDKMCCCLDLKKGVLCGSTVIIVLVVIAIIEIIWTMITRDSGVSQASTGTIVWEILVIICFVYFIYIFSSVLYVIIKDKSIDLLLSPLQFSVMITIADLVCSIVFLVLLRWINAALSLVQAVLIAYYVLGLNSFYQANKPVLPSHINININIWMNMSGSSAFL